MVNNYEYYLSVVLELIKMHKIIGMNLTEWEEDFLNDNVVSPLKDPDIFPEDLTMSPKQQAVIVDIGKKYERKVKKYSGN